MWMARRTEPKRLRNGGPGAPKRLQNGVKMEVKREPEGGPGPGPELGDLIFLFMPTVSSETTVLKIRHGPLTVRRRPVTPPLRNPPLGTRTYLRN